MAGRSLAEWLAFQERVHPRAMDFTLERITALLDRLGVRKPRARVITVGGTNGKGSVASFLESMLRAAGRRVGLYTSPHLSRYQERIRIDGAEIDSTRLIEVFERIEAARREITLTFFEYATAAALLAFDDLGVEFIVLEVGLGGRLDAVNAIDADVAVVASIGFDHRDYLGDTLEAIGREKAGIFRNSCPAIFGSLEMPDSIESEAKRIGARLERLGADFNYVCEGREWSFRRGALALERLPPPSLEGPVQYANAATALAALAAGGWLPDEAAIARGLTSVVLAGRFEVRAGPVAWVFDVAHNPAAAAALARTMRVKAPAGRWLLVTGILADKDAEAIALELKGALRPGDGLCTVTLAGERGRTATELAAILGPILGRTPVLAESVEAGCAHAAREAQPGDAVLVFGSFHTVGPAREWHRLYCAEPRR